ncbi:MAG: DUF1801 domain-containing protein [Pseudomonadota bacterium]
MPELSPQKQLDGFIEKYTPAIAKLTRAALKTMRARLPSATQLVYDNYNALVIGFGPNEKPSLAIFSIAAFADHVSLCFLQGAGLDDPKKRLLGAGNVARHIKFTDIKTLDDKDVVQLMDQALLFAKTPIDPNAKGKLIIRSISAKQRPRRP